MSTGAVLLARGLTREQRKFPFLFSRYKFERMKQAGNTHFCFFCVGNQGFTPGPGGKPINHICNGYNGMKEHDPIAHAKAVIGDADKFDDPRSWLEAKVPPDFPCSITITL